jgi:hypothetical protein
VTPAAFRAALPRLTYKPGWRLIVEPHLPGWPDARVYQVRWEFTAPCAVTGKPDIQVCATHVLDPYYIPDEQSLFNRILHIVRQCEEHETLEFFKVDGAPLYDPHH